MSSICFTVFKLRVVCDLIRASAKFGVSESCGLRACCGESASSDGELVSLRSGLRQLFQLCHLFAKKWGSEVCVTSTA